MSESKTPRTDAVANYCEVPAEFCRRLEIELSEATRKLSALEAQIQSGELAYVDAVYALTQKRGLQMNFLSVKEFLKRYAAEQARKAGENHG